ncbi:hypothetical protein [Paractinoplanes atraurantiacus]|uniref:EamA-like transporter family protein n=1 Tax=Paractinoplanes atraurantiacus TaxID=1036182 RepID=A0A285IM72_9ACTN|nr:hypothetical protein [Actinoplanes atraurantiacus]SNY49110.1 hypothetical protein SAMN05421748_109219 [Actinoplanes atraurantiacus]
MSLLIAVLAAVAYAGGSVLQAAAARRPGTVLALAVSPLYLAGLAGDGGGWLLSLWALRGLPVYVVQAVLAGSVGLTVLLAGMVLRTRLRRRDYAAVGVMVGALAVIGLSSREQPAAMPAHGTTVILAVGGFAAAALAGAAVLSTARTDRRSPQAGAQTDQPAAARTSPPPAVGADRLDERPGVGNEVSGLVLAGLAGLAYSATALAGRAVHLRTPWVSTLTEPLLWVVICSGVAGTAAYAAALRRGSVAPVTALLWAVEVIVPAAVAVPLLGDEIRHGWAVPAVLGILAVVGAAAVLAGSSGTAASAGAERRTPEQQPSERAPAT